MNRFRTIINEYYTDINIFKMGIEFTQFHFTSYIHFRNNLLKNIRTIPIIMEQDAILYNMPA